MERDKTMASGEIKVDYEALQTGIYLLNSVVESLRFSSQATSVASTSKGAMTDQAKDLLIKLSGLEVELGTLASNTRQVMDNASIRLKQSEAEIIQALIRLGELELDPPSYISSPQ
ncbi:MAG: hypothetical protein LBS58_05400 [Coriobacteriales bacterium]|jgi:hypothetical protein|nr:hypothetical protein [Coriobacteriales bacterium]